VPGTVPVDGQDEQPPDDGENRGAIEHEGRVADAAEAAQEVRQCRADRECPDEDADRQSSPPTKPARHQLHARWVHPGERHTG